MTTGHDVADARLHRTVRSLQRAGLSVEVVGLGDPGNGPDGSIVRTAPRSGPVRRAARALAWPWRADAPVLLTIDPDTVPMAWLAQRLRRRAWVADVHEDYGALLMDRSWVPRPLLPVLQGAVRVIMNLVTRADLVLVADDHVPPRAARQRLVLRNEPDLHLLPPLRTARPPGDFRALYVGDNRGSRGLRAMVEAVAATASDAQPWALDLVGALAPSDRPWLEARLADPDCSRVAYHGRLPPQAAWDFARRADVGLCLLADTPAFRDAMPSKVYEYQACGIPTIATPLPRVAALLEETGAGVIVNDHDETVAALRRFAADGSHRSHLVAAAAAAGLAARQRPNPYDRAAGAVAELASSVQSR